MLRELPGEPGSAVPRAPWSSAQARGPEWAFGASAASRSAGSKTRRLGVHYVWSSVSVVLPCCSVSHCTFTAVTYLLFLLS